VLHRGLDDPITASFGVLGALRATFGHVEHGTARRTPHKKNPRDLRLAEDRSPQPPSAPRALGAPSNRRVLRVAVRIVAGFALRRSYHAASAGFALRRPVFGVPPGLRLAARQRREAPRNLRPGGLGLPGPVAPGGSVSGAGTTSGLAAFPGPRDRSPALRPSSVPCAESVLRLLRRSVRLLASHFDCLERGEMYR
jgi:hypothetical protein